ncbi:MAG: hypothetical protein JWL81_1653 [Verrucomicrobiales bacterium]|nr:hypothetical protein [Verrucomicrobiales bacterium]
MNDQPNDPFYSDDPMDTKLLQLERELFSLTPAEAPRSLVCRLDRHLTAPTQVGRSVVPAARSTPPNVTVFQWRRIVVPAAAAVVVVSVLNRMDGTPSSMAQTASAAGLRAPASGQPAPAVSQVQNSGYVLRAEPVYFSPGVWDSVRHQYWVQPGTPAASQPMNVPRRQSLVPVSFH